MATHRPLASLWLPSLEATLVLQAPQTQFRSPAAQWLRRVALLGAAGARGAGAFCPPHQAGALRRFQTVEDSPARSGKSPKPAPPKARTQLRSGYPLPAVPFDQPVRANGGCLGMLDGNFVPSAFPRRFSKDHLPQRCSYIIRSGCRQCVPIARLPPKPVGDIRHVRFGSKAVIDPSQPNVRFAPIADIVVWRSRPNLA